MLKLKRKHQLSKISTLKASAFLHLPAVHFLVILSWLLTWLLLITRVGSCWSNWSVSPALQSKHRHNKSQVFTNFSRCFLSTGAQLSSTLFIWQGQTHKHTFCQKQSKSLCHCCIIKCADIFQMFSWEDVHSTGN